MKILDMSAGNRAIWFDKNNPLAMFLDCRGEVNPTIVCDTREIPDEVGSGYDLIVFDPPHTNCGPNGQMKDRYGHHTADEIRDIVARSSAEAHRVSKPGALLAFKWNDHGMKLGRILSYFQHWEPLFGHTVKNNVGTKHRPGGTKTWWIMFRRLDEPKDHCKGRL